jgi:hypothetical protein
MFYVLINVARKIIEFDLILYSLSLAFDKNSMHFSIFYIN